MPRIGRRQKRRKKNATTESTRTSSPSRLTTVEMLDCIQPPTTPSSPLKQSSVAAMHTSILRMLDMTCVDEESKINVVTTLLAKMSATGANPITPVHLESPAAECPPFHTASTPTVAYDPRAFLKGVPTKESLAAARQQKKRAIDKFGGSFEEALKRIGDTRKQLLVVHGYTEKAIKANKEVAAPLLTALQTSAATAEALDCRSNLKEIFEIAAKTNRTNDSKSFQKTVMMAVASSDTDPEDKRAVDGVLRLLSLKRNRTNVSRAKEAIKARIACINSDKPQLLQTVKGCRVTRFTPAVIQALHEWVLTKCSLVVASPNQKDVVRVKDPVTGAVTKQQKKYYVSSVQELFLELIKPVEDGGFEGAWNEDGSKLLLSDTTLRQLLPRNLRRLTDSQKAMCGCEICITAKGLLRSLNAWQTRVSNSMKQEAADEDNPTLKQQLVAAYETYVASTHRWQHPRDAVASMTCQPCTVGEAESIHKMKCCLGRCDECPPLDIPDLEADKEETARTITFQVYEYHSSCSIHNSLPGAPTTCATCKAIKDDPNCDDATGKLSRKQHLTQKSKVPIGSFMAEYFLPTMEKYRYHQQHVALLGKHHAVRERKDACKEVGGVLTQRDYADALLASFTDEIQSTHFGENASVSMEGVTIRFTDPNTGEDRFHFYSYLSDDKRQDSRTTYVNTEAMVKELQQHQLQLKPDSILYELMDGCAKQYRCANCFYLMSALAAKYTITIDRMISAPHHGKGDVDSQNGIDKNYCRCHFRKIATPEVLGDDRFMSAHTVMDGKKRSMAEAMHKLLSVPARCNGGLKSYRKSAKREAKAVINCRKYQVVHHGNKDHVATAELPILGTKFTVASGFKQKKNEKYNGTTGHYHFYADYHLGVGRCAARRIPCACDACRQQIQLPWNESLPPLEQPRFKTPTDCKRKEIFGTFNDWTILEIRPMVNEVEEEDMEELFEDILGAHEINITQDIQPGQFGAYESRDEYYLVKWTSNAYALPVDSINIEGLDGNILEAGSIVADGIYWNPVGRATHWYTPPTVPQVHKFRVRYVASTNIEMEAPSDTVKLPNRRDRAAVMALQPLRLSKAAHELIQAAMARRARINFEEGGTYEAASDNEGGNSSDDESDVEEEEE